MGLNHACLPFHQAGELSTFIGFTLSHSRVCADALPIELMPHGKEHMGLEPITFGYYRRVGQRRLIRHHHTVLKVPPRGIEPRLPG